MTFKPFLAVCSIAMPPAACETTAEDQAALNSFGNLIGTMASMQSTQSAPVCRPMPTTTYVAAPPPAPVYSRNSSVASTYYNPAPAFHRNAVKPRNDNPGSNAGTSSGSTSGNCVDIA